MWIRLFGLFALLMLSACGTSRQMLAPGDAAAHYTTLANREVSCAEGDRGCNGAHLVKGEACLRLASAGEERFQSCAVRHLALGIDMAAQEGSRSGVEQPYFESLMEALRLRRDRAATRTEAAPFAAQLESRARVFRKRFPDAPAGYYYLLSARLKRALDAAEASPAVACRALDDAQTLLEDAPSDRGLYGPDFSRAAGELRSLQATVPGCADA